MQSKKEKSPVKSPIPNVLAQITNTGKFMGTENVKCMILVRFNSLDILEEVT